jgi:hypothetical protein
MDNERKILYFQMNMLQAEIEMNAMVAENKQGEFSGKVKVYNYKDFMDLIEKYNIHHNAFPYYEG